VGLYSLDGMLRNWEGILNFVDIRKKIILFDKKE